MIVLASLSLACWIYLWFGHGRFWAPGPMTPATPNLQTPSIAIIIPARNEAAVLTRSLTSLLAQDYSGEFTVIVVDDCSTDDTAEVARTLSHARLRVLDGLPRPSGWSGKLWAISQGLAEAADATYVYLTDADIEHEPAHLSTLVAKAEHDELDLVSEMVQLSCASAAERMLVPAFVFFFQLLYPFAWVNDLRRRTAAAAGGTILLRATALARIGGIASIRGALIDDVALATAVKKGGSIWLGHSRLATSVRPYPQVADIWRMVARTAYVQLRYSPALLIGTVVGMVIIWMVPAIALLFGHGLARWIGLMSSVALTVSYIPTLRRFGLSSLRAVVLPIIALFYTAATIGSAIDHYLGRGVVWKQRSYRQVSS